VQKEAGKQGIDGDILQVVGFVPRFLGLEFEDGAGDAIVAFNWAAGLEADGELAHDSGTDGVC